MFTGGSEALFDVNVKTVRRDRSGVEVATRETTMISCVRVASGWGSRSDA
jgi:hypothetical protein